MTQKTLPILGTACAISLVLLGFVAGCKKKDEKEEVSSDKDKGEATKEPSPSEEKKDINMSDSQEKSAETDVSSESEEVKKEEGGDNKEEKSEEDKKEKKKKANSSSKGDEKRVALVEKTLKDMAVALSDSRNKSKSVEDDVLLA
ncbi:hypothetical protein [Holospora undulata]|uniref:Lipoprotein n=1 Tax=Holospora undulata HU1 TaxID=1321371 RepID=A0A061JIB7_9PROT|nr:hypothetical protein [Holospora undulata]ETZ05273.1 hypothetical protein K737_300293 [Holospora undulata HU1]